MVDSKTKVDGRKKPLAKSFEDKSQIEKVKSKEEKHVEFDSKLEISPDSKLEPDIIVLPDSNLVM